MQKRQVDGVDVSFIPLEIVAAVEDLRHRSLRLRHGEKFVIRQQGWFTGAHISKNDSAHFLARVRKMADRISLRAAAGLAGLLDHATANVVQPAMIQASQTAVLDPAIAQVGAAMRTMEPQQSRPALVITKEDKLFAHDPDRLRRSAQRQLFGKRHRLPVTAQQFAGGSFWIGLSE